MDMDKRRDYARRAFAAHVAKKADKAVEPKVQQQTAPPPPAMKLTPKAGSRAVHESVRQDQAKDAAAERAERLKRELDAKKTIFKKKDLDTARGF